MMEPIQIIAIIFVIFAMSRVFLRYKSKEISTGEFIFWFAVWGVIILVASFPAITEFFSDMFGVGRGMDFAIYVSVILLFYMVFRIYVKLERIEQDMTLLVRETAIQERGSLKKKR